MPNPGALAISVDPDNKDLFYLDLKYDVLQSGLSGTLQKSGNISQVIWRSRGRERQSYSLRYDFLDRLTTATYNGISDAGTLNNAGAYNENLSYDPRGNITNLTRTGKYKNPTCWTDATIDNLTYTYTANTNRLQKIADATANTNGWHNIVGAPATAQFTYDANGNLANDPYKGMAVQTNFLNLPVKFTFPGNKVIDILYDGSGSKLRKTVTDNGVLQYKQDYVSGIEYRSTSAVSLSLESIYHAEGRVFNTNVGTTSADMLRYEYTIKDHLGNARLTFTDKNSNGVVDVTNTSTNEVLQENHYYPFGLNMSGPWMDDTAARDNFYQYNGKELNTDFGLGWNDYGARWYDAGLGRWWSVDPLTEITPSEASYAYAGNNPITHVDIGGLYKYPAGKEAEYAAKYSILTKYLMSGIGEILKNTDVISGLKIMGRFSQEEIESKILKFGEGIEIEITDEVLGNGYTPGSVQNKMQINMALVNQLQNSTPENRQAALLAVVSTILHETIHDGFNHGYAFNEINTRDGKFQRKGAHYYYEGKQVGVSESHPDGGGESGDAFESVIFGWSKTEDLDFNKYNIDDLKKRIKNESKPPKFVPTPPVANRYP